MEPIIMLTWDEYYSDLKKFSDMISAADKKYDFIISIATGGWIPALVFAKRSGNKALSIGTYGYVEGSNLRLPEQVIYQQPPVKSLKRKKVLVIDEIVDSGRTMQTITKLLDKYKVNYKTAAVYKRRESAFVPDFYLKEVTNWVKFPYDS